MSSKKWLVMLPLTLLLVMGCCAVFNMLIDPFGVFGDPILDWYSYNETNNPRVAKLAWLDEHYQQYDSYVIGSSSAASYNVEELNDYLDASFYNLFVYGCDTRDYRDFAAYVLEHYTVKNIVLNLGINEAVYYDEGEDDLNGKMHAKASGRSLPLFYLEYALTTTLQSVEKLASRLRDTELPQVFDVFLVESGCYDKRVRDVEKIGDPAVYDRAYTGEFSTSEQGGQLPYVKECAQMVAEIRDLCAERGVNLMVITSPVYAGQWNAYEESALRAYKTALADVTDYWDFSCTPISYDNRYFYDQTHFRNAVGTMVLAEIFGNDQVWRPERFGAWITADNCQTYLDGLFSDPPTAKVEDYTADVPVLLYHSIVEEPGSYLEVSPETFDAQMRFLAENGYHAVTTQELIDYVYHGGELPDKPVLISFDDGYQNNYDYAWPILREHDLKATIYAIGVSVGHDRYKDTQFEMTPHFGFEEARRMVESGVIDVQSHTYDMHQWPPFESGDRIRQTMAPLEGEIYDDYAAALNRDVAAYNQIAKKELGYEFTSLAFPGGDYTTLTEVLVHQAGIPVTMSTQTDNRNILVRGLPQSLYALSRWSVMEETTQADLLEVLNG